MKLKDLLEKHDFRLYRTDLQTQRLKENSNTIRICWGYDEWFEFGFNEWKDREEKLNNIKKILTKEILNREVECFQSDDEMNILVINLKED